MKKLSKWQSDFSFGRYKLTKDKIMFTQHVLDELLIKILEEITGREIYNDSIELTQIEVRYSPHQKSEIYYKGESIGKLVVYHSQPDLDASSFRFTPHEYYLSNQIENYNE